MRFNLFCFLEVSLVMATRGASVSWFGTNPEQEPAEPDISRHPIATGFGLNVSLDEDLEYRSNITMEDCTRLYKSEISSVTKLNRGGFCNVTFDLLLCWPPTPLNGTAQVKCFSELLGIRYDDSQNATRKCLWNGTWSKTNYSQCKEIDPFPVDIVNTQVNIYVTGFVLSAFTLAIAIFIFTYFKELRCLRNKIHMNLMWSYVLTYIMWIIILVEMNFRNQLGVVTCVFAVTLLHYFHITTFFWMFVEGLYLYILVVRTLTRESFKLRVYAVIGWGAPMFFIVLWALVKAFVVVPKKSSSPEECTWFTAHHIDYIFQAPTLIVTFVNVVFLISIMVVLVTKLRSANTLEIQQYRKAMKALAVLIPLLGVTYAITIYMPSFTLVDMVRAALLSVQGFMVALFYCFLNMEVQNTLKHHFENWKTKKSLGPNRLRSSSRSKDWSPRSRTESIRLCSVGSIVNLPISTTRGNLALPK
ncbi:diuretic hormone receptor-like isoform X2 [Cylas formicarius]|uniref:diuretic hormone receptor-like isoform X2 n=1 Tax=Cylas formicarius TaxID=197179 RepID=UPI002958890D|nr:diuretic hormone receptor-like isoform X2 [Cylas formicarius]